jgi:hypothetical protein
MARSSSVNTQQTNLDAFGRFVSESFEASPIQSFLAGVFIYITSIAGAALLMVRRLTPGTSDNAIPQQQCP